MPSGVTPPCRRSPATVADLLAAPPRARVRAEPFELVALFVGALFGQDEA
jgi:hypothetical protein